MSAIPILRFGLMLTGCLLFVSPGHNRLTADETSPAFRQAEAVSEDDPVSRKGMPAWFIENRVFSDAEGMLYVRTSTHCMNIFQAEEELGRESLLAVNRVLDDWLGQPGSAEKIGLDEKYVLENLVFEDHKEIRIDDDPEIEDLHRRYNISSDGDYYCGYAQLHLDDDFRQYAREQWQEVETRERLIGGGLIGGSVLTLLAISFGYLKLESATRGFYSRRLQTVAILLIMTAAIALIWFRQLLFSAN